MDDISREELLRVIGDFLEMGHVENIVAMFKKDDSHYGLTGDLLRDERFAVRLGMAVLFEELVRIRPRDTTKAIASLLPLLTETTPVLRGEAANILGIINTDEALRPLKPLRNDPDSQVAEIVGDILGDR
jgi:hypothetical protein